MTSMLLLLSHNQSLAFKYNINPPLPQTKYDKTLEQNLVLLRFAKIPVKISIQIIFIQINFITKLSLIGNLNFEANLWQEILENFIILNISPSNNSPFF
jgi:hypothetical protein